GAEGAAFAGDAGGGEPGVDGLGEAEEGELGVVLDAGPNDAGRAAVGEGADAAEIEGEVRWLRDGGGELLLDGRESVRGDVADELEGEVDAFRPDPADADAGGRGVAGEGGLHAGLGLGEGAEPGLGELEGDEEAEAAWLFGGHAGSSRSRAAFAPRMRSRAVASRPASSSMRRRERAWESRG